MGEFFFGLGRGRVKEPMRRRVDRIAARHGACFVNPNLPGEGWRYWFAAPNLGHPFDQATARAVADDLDKAGIDLSEEAG